MCMWAKEVQEHYEQNSVDDSGRSPEDQGTDSNVRKKAMPVRFQMRVRTLFGTGQEVVSLRFWPRTLL